MLVQEVSYIENEPKNEIGLQLKSPNVKVVRNIFEHLGYDVLRSDRVAFAGLTKKNLPRGNWRLLTEQEIINFDNNIMQCSYRLSGNKKYTLENALTTSLKKSKQKDALFYPEPIHRLDYPTSGAILIGKTSQAVIFLNKMFKKQKIKKKYKAITIGSQKKHGIIECPINEKPSKSKFKNILSIPSRKYGFLNLIELIPYT